MGRKLKVFLLVIFIIGLSFSAFYFWSSKLFNYLIISLTLLIVLILALIIYVKHIMNPDNIYNGDLKQILKTYDSILVEINKLPKLYDKNIIEVKSVEELIDAQVEIRKPIYFKLDVDACSFILLDGNEACVFVFKRNSSDITDLEKVINSMYNKENIEILE
ncbi:MAG: hypothetical protein J6B89_00495 [Bacilli bacterium]|nr:hypothetical protein [Bacilli bacterium]